MSNDKQFTAFDLPVTEAPGYLGRAELVQNLVENFIQNGVLGAKDPGMAMMASLRMALIFAGQIEGYTPVPGWEEDQCEVLCRRLGIDPSQSPKDILYTAFLDIAENVFKAVKNPDPEAADKRIRDISEFLAHLLLGTVDAVYHPVR